MATVLEVQRTRTPEKVERARADVKKTVLRFADVLGPAFNGSQSAEDHGAL